MESTRFSPAPIEPVRWALRVLALLLPVFLFGRAVIAQSGTPGFGTQWVRSHPFTTFGFPYGEYTIAVYQGANFSSYFTDSLNGGYYQIPWVALSYIDDTQATLQARLTQPYITINYLADEPTDAQLPQVAANAAYARTVAPNLPILINSGISWTGSNQAELDQYLEHLFQQVNPDILSFDRYPWLVGQSSYDPAYFGYLMAIRAASLQYNVPFFDWVQSVAHIENGNLRMPSESELRMNVFSSLTAGSKGIIYWTFGISGPDSRVHITESLIKADGTPDAMYPVAADINAQVDKLGRALRYLTSTAVGFIPGSPSSPLPQGLSQWSSASDTDPHLLDIQIDNGIVGRDGMIGFFTDDDGQNYFMLTNLYCATDLTSIQAATTFHLVFDEQTTALLQLNPLTGQTDLIPLNEQHTLDLTLGGGQGALFKYNTGPFAGVPEPSGFFLAGLVFTLAASRRHSSGS